MSGRLTVTTHGLVDSSALINSLHSSHALTPTNKDGRAFKEGHAKSLESLLGRNDYAAAEQRLLGLSDADAKEEVSNLLDKDKKWYPLHYCCAYRADELPTHHNPHAVTIIDRLLKLYPEAAGANDADGHLPIHLYLHDRTAAGTLRPPLPHVVSFLLEAYPSAASHIDPYTQTLPLHNILTRFRGSEPETLHHALDLYEDAVKCHLPGNLAADDGKPCLLRLILQYLDIIEPDKDDDQNDGLSEDAVNYQFFIRVLDLYPAAVRLDTEKNTKIHDKSEQRFCDPPSLLLLTLSNRSIASAPPLAALLLHHHPDLARIPDKHLGMPMFKLANSMNKIGKDFHTALTTNIFTAFVANLTDEELGDKSKNLPPSLAGVHSVFKGAFEGVSRRAVKMFRGNLSNLSDEYRTITQNSYRTLVDIESLRMCPEALKLVVADRADVIMSLPYNTALNLYEMTHDSELKARNHHVPTPDPDHALSRLVHPIHFLLIAKANTTTRHDVKSLLTSQVAKMLPKLLPSDPKESLKIDALLAPDHRVDLPADIDCPSSSAFELGCAMNAPPDVLAWLYLQCPREEYFKHGGREEAVERVLKDAVSEIQNITRGIGQGITRGTGKAKGKGKDEKVTLPPNIEKAFLYISSNTAYKKLLEKATSKITHVKTMQHLSNLKDAEGRSLMTTEMQQVLQKGALFMQRYSLDDVPVHVSATCVVVAATDRLVDFDAEQFYKEKFEQAVMKCKGDQMDDRKVVLKEVSRLLVYHSEDGQLGDLPYPKDLPLTAKAFSEHCAKNEDKARVEKSRSLVIKFMRNKSEWEREISRRKDFSFEDQFVVDVEKKMEVIEGADAADHTVFSAANVKQGLILVRGVDEEVPYKYALIMHRADKNLESIFRSERPEILKTTTFLKELATCVDHMHSLKVAHGDLKMLNVVRSGDVMKLIDLDACAIFTHNIGKKFSSGILPPEMIEKLDEGGVESFDKYYIKEKEMDSDLWKKVKPRQIPGDQSHSSYVVKSVNSEHHETETLPYKPIIASPAHDAWSFGTIMFQLICQDTLFKVNRDDDLTQARDFKELHDWSDTTRDQRLDEAIPVGLPNPVAVRGLLSQCLGKAPSSRPTFNEILNHPFFVVAAATTQTERDILPLHDLLTNQEYEGSDTDFERDFAQQLLDAKSDEQHDRRYLPCNHNFTVKDGEATLYTLRSLPVHLLLLSRYCTLDRVKDLLPPGDVPSDSRGNTYLHLLFHNTDPNQSVDHLKLLKHLLELNPDSLSAENSDGDTPLHCFAANINAYPTALARTLWKTLTDAAPAADDRNSLLRSLNYHVAHSPKQTALHIACAAIEECARGRGAAFDTIEDMWESYNAITENHAVALHDGFRHTPLICALNNVKAPMELCVKLFELRPDAEALLLHTSVGLEEMRKRFQGESTRRLSDASPATPPMLGSADMRRRLGSSIRRQGSMYGLSVTEQEESGVMQNKRRKELVKSVLSKAVSHKEAFCCIVGGGHGDSYLAEVTECVNKLKPSEALALCEFKDKQDRRCLDLAAKKVKAVLLKRMLFVGKYKVESGTPMHMSSTCVVVKARQLIIDGEYDPGRQQEWVAIKFMKDRESFERETRTRRMLVEGENSALSQDLSSFMIDVVDTHEDYVGNFKEQLRGLDVDRGGLLDAQKIFDDIDVDHNGIIDFEEYTNCKYFAANTLEESEKRELFNICRGHHNKEGITIEDFKRVINKVQWDLYSYMIVMPLADRNLAEIFNSERPSVTELPGMMQQIGKCMQEMSLRNVCHGDLKLKNVVRRLGKLVMIDLDCSGMFGEWGAGKFSSSVLGKDYFYQLKNVEEERKYLNHVRLEDTYDRVKEEVAFGNGEEKYKGVPFKLRPKGTDFGWVVKTFISEKRIEKYELPYAREMLRVDDDIWSFGCMVFQLCCGEALFECDRDEDMVTKEVVEFQEFSLKRLQDRMNRSSLEDTAAFDLISEIFFGRNGKTTLKSWQKVLEHHFFTRFDGNNTKEDKEQRRKDKDQCDRNHREVMDELISSRKRDEELKAHVLNIEKITIKIQFTCVETQKRLATSTASILNGIMEATEVETPTAFIILPYKLGANGMAIGNGAEELYKDLIEINVMSDAAASLQAEVKKVSDLGWGVRIEKAADMVEQAGEVWGAIEKLDSLDKMRDAGTGFLRNFKGLSGVRGMMKSCEKVIDRGLLGENVKALKDGVKDKVDMLVENSKTKKHYLYLIDEFTCKPVVEADKGKGKDVYPIEIVSSSPLFKEAMPAMLMGIQALQAANGILTVASMLGAPCPKLPAEMGVFQKMKECTKESTVAQYDVLQGCMEGGKEEVKVVRGHDLRKLGEFLHKEDADKTYAGLRRMCNADGCVLWTRHVEEAKAEKVSSLMSRNIDGDEWPDAFEKVEVVEETASISQPQQVIRAASEANPARVEQQGQQTPNLSRGMSEPDARRREEMQDLMDDLKRTMADDLRKTMVEVVGGRESPVRSPRAFLEPINRDRGESGGGSERGANNTVVRSWNVSVEVPWKIGGLNMRKLWRDAKMELKKNGMVKWEVLEKCEDGKVPKKGVSINPRQASSQIASRPLVGGGVKGSKYMVSCDFFFEVFSHGKLRMFACESDEARTDIMAIVNGEILDGEF